MATSLLIFNWSELHSAPRGGKRTVGRHRATQRYSTGDKRGPTPFPKQTHASTGAAILATMSGSQRDSQVSATFRAPPVLRRLAARAGMHRPPCCHRALEFTPPFPPTLHVQGQGHNHKERELRSQIRDLRLKAQRE